MPEVALSVPNDARDATGWRHAIRLAPKILLLGFICYLSTEHLSTGLGFAHTLGPYHVSPLWPTGAILFAVLVVVPVRHWWAYTLAAYFTAVVYDARAGFPLSAQLFLVAALVEVFIAALGVRRVAGGLRAFDSVRNLALYLLVAVVLAPATSAFIGAFALAGGSYWFNWRVWALSEALAYLTLAPAFLAWIAGARSVRHVSLAQGIEACLIGGGLLAVSFTVFSWPAAGDSTVPALVYSPLPLLLWAALRFRPIGTNTCLLTIACVSIGSAVHRLGPFAVSAEADNVLSLQLFLITISVPVMLLAAAIEERRAQTKGLAESEARFRAMADTAPVLIWIAGSDKLCSFFNRGRLDFTGRRLEQELGDGWLQGVHPDDRDECLARRMAAFDARREFSLEYRLRRRDGEYRVILDRGVPRFAGDGEFLGYIGCGNDITERAQAEDRARLVLEAAPNAMIMVTQAGKITLINAAVEAVFGYARDELIGSPIEILIPDRFLPHHAAHRDDYFAAPKAGPLGAGLDLFGRRKDGREVPVEIGLTPIETSEGRFVLASIIDITERKRAELETQLHRSELAHVTRIATMGELATSLAHELNQPLTAILSNVQAAQRFLAADAPDLGMVREILADVVQDDVRAGEVIHRMRALLRNERPNVRALDVGELLRDVASLVHSDAILRNNRVALDVTPGLRPVRGDRIQLQQVVLNLLLNAFDAMKDCPANERHVVVRAAPDGAHVLRIAVRDRGAGVSRDALERIFEPFYTTKPGGLGMGLSISRSIVDAHGGRLWAENNTERGATFSFTLPAGAET